MQRIRNFLISCLGLLLVGSAKRQVDVSNFSIESGAIVLLHVPVHVSPEAARRLGTQFKEAMPEGVKVVVVQGVERISVFCPAHQINSCRSGTSPC